VAAIATTLENSKLNSTIDLFLREAHQADAECLDLRMSLSGAPKNN